MTNEEAIKFLKQLYPNGGGTWLDDQRIEAISMAVNALEKCKKEESRLSTLERNGKSYKETASEYLEGELRNWRHKHFHGRRDMEASGEYLERSSQYDLVRHIAEWQRQQMMKDAVEGRVLWLANERTGMKEIRTELPLGSPFDFGEEVKIIVVKEKSV